MLPIGPLMIEHRLIEKMIQMMQGKAEIWRREERIDREFVDEAVDFLRVYADKCHHGKEEGILFRELGRKQLFGEHLRLMEELVEDHRQARKTVVKMVEAKEEYILGSKGMLPVILDCMEFMTDFYPRHIEKEDKHFFLPCMNYFTPEEKDLMLKEGWEYDKNLIHDLYREKINMWDAR
ncbi:MAG: Hemerythrin HHE cation binding domain protein [Syntrophorhabdus sp. PtaU1.Bin002]|nr:MAG: Hemerythrin HHE cation binding domain protein [Syntrophorhabdus sp. PtaB.Bin006]OPY71765.1 MAG: Hemerythrin HHE cation binding domain protein [Syntrophorhabdus sp. PtaU1.Bin002]